MKFKLEESTKYGKWYNRIIQIADNRKLSEVYDKHHILPQSIFPEFTKHTQNIVELTIREHFIVHFLLMKHYKSLGMVREYMKMSFAFSWMTTEYSKHRGLKVTSRIYEIVRKNSSVSRKIWLKENGHPMEGKSHSEETKKKMSESRMGIKLSQETKDKMSESRKGSKHHMFGKFHSESSLKKMSGVKKGKVHSKEHKIKISESRKGFKHSDESKEKMKIQRKNLPNVECPHCGKEGHQMAMKRWHFNNCKNKGE